MEHVVVYLALTLFWLSVTIGLAVAFFLLLTWRAFRDSLSGFTARARGQELELGAGAGGGHAPGEPLGAPGPEPGSRVGQTSVERAVAASHASPGGPNHRVGCSFCRRVRAALTRHL